MPIKLVVIAAVVFLMPVLSMAQDNGMKWEVFGTAGYGKAYDDEGNIGSGLDLGGGFGYRITPKLGIEGTVNWFKHSREFGPPNPVRFEGTAISGAANLVYHFSESKVQPFVTGGVGGLRHEDTSSGFGLFFPPRSASGFAYNFGGGVKIFVSRHVSLRPEGRILVANLGSGGIEPPFSQFRFSMGIGYHW
jgi:opacity protein-like surface antigen